MRFPKSIDNIYLADLSHQIQTLPSDEAASALFECGTILEFRLIEIVQQKTTGNSKEA